MKMQQILAAGALALSVSAARADTIAYESFSYGGSPNLAGANGGTGWGSAWFKLSQIPTGAIMEGMSWPGLPVAGGSAITAAYPSADYTRYSRAIAPYSAPNDEIFISFLFRPNIGFGVGGGLAFGTWDNGMIAGLVPGSGHYGLSGFTGPSSVGGEPATLNQTVLLVAHVEKLDNGTIGWSLYVNPTVGNPMPSSPDASMAIPGTTLPPAINLYNDGGFSTDEIRIATTWEEALGQPASACNADLDSNGMVDAADLGILLGQWSTSGSADLDGDGIVNGADLAAMLGAWGSCP
ncbi:MAG: hypothetical protein JNM94_12155 [Phycisphaerae bacterium]|nr:hypothetical protein [Phycisphaerae bacterium]